MLDDLSFFGSSHNRAAPANLASMQSRVGTFCMSIVYSDASYFIILKIEDTTASARRIILTLTLDQSGALISTVVANLVPTWRYNRPTKARHQALSVVPLDKLLIRQEVQVRSAKMKASTVE